MTKPKQKRTPRRPPPAAGLTAKQRHGLAILAKEGQLEPLLRDLAAHIASAKTKH